MFYPDPERSINSNSHLYPIGIEGGIPDTTRFCDVTQSPYNADSTGQLDVSAAINKALADSPAG
jgi:hypothetical protein